MEPNQIVVTVPAYYLVFLFFELILFVAALILC